MGHLASRRDSHGRIVGGRLYVTNLRLLFRPEWLERKRGRAEWSVSRETVLAVEIDPPNLLDRKFSGIRRRVRVELGDRDPEVFVVYRPDRTVHELRRFLNDE